MVFYLLKTCSEQVDYWILLDLGTPKFLLLQIKDFQDYNLADLKSFVYVYVILNILGFLEEHSTFPLLLAELQPSTPARWQHSPDKSPRQ